MTSPCKECQRRTLGCHDSKVCEDWRRYVEERKKVRDARAAVKEQGNDFEQHLRRHGCKLPRR